MQPSDIGRLVNLSDPRVSPDGRDVAFVVNRVDLAANRYRSAVWVAAVDGSSPPRQLTAGTDTDGAPRWSPDGRRLAFTRSRSGDGDRHTLVVLPVAAAGEAVVVCARPEAIEEPVWSPDGARIAFCSRERTARWTDGEDERARPPRRIDRLLSRLDGEGWLIDRPRSVFVVDAAGSGVPRLVAGGPYEHGGPAWSPDGRTVVVSAAREPDVDLDPWTGLYLIDVDGAEQAMPRLLTDRSMALFDPAFAPDGATIAVLVGDERIVPTHAQVAVVDVATGTWRTLTASLDRNCAPLPGTRAPVWADGSLLFAIEDHGNVHVLRVPADGSGAPEVLVGGARAVNGYDAAAGVLAFVASDAARAAELFVRDADGTERRLTDLSAGLHAAVPTAATEHFTVPSAVGDGDIDVWLIRPTVPAEGERTPVLLSIHGGPMTQYSTAWFDEFQLWAGAGYAVVACNPHGSTGRAQSWSRTIRGPEAKVEAGPGWGTVDADDVLTALDAALARDPQLDPDRVGVLGGSYGGYLTSWLVGHTDRFVAACSERACNNLESEEWSSDAAGFFQFEFGYSHLEYPEAYRRMSPMTYVRDITTPMLLLHSENDLRCHVEQADQLFVALRMLDREVEYWRFPEEGHELSRTGSPRHRVQRAEIILEFFGRHLGGRIPTITWDHPAAAPRR